MKHHAKQTSVALAVLLQLAPMARQVITQIAEFTPNIAVIFRWGVGLSALMGTVDAVSGASTVITSPSTATGTVGVPFTFRLTTGPQVATSYSASPLPPGLTLAASTGRITGTPTQPGITVALVKGCDAGNGCTPNATLTITIVAGGPTAPSITSQPANLTVTAGNSATFNVTATGTAPLSYQWRFNGGDIAGATASSYTIANAQAANAGTYSVFVSNSAGSVTSANATLTVNPAPIAPSITTPPASLTVNNGSSASFSVVAAGTAPLFYQWKLNGANIAGATASTYTLNNAQVANAGSYSVLVSNVAGSVTSAAATLVVNIVPVAPTITTQPVSQSVIVGANVNFTVSATGTGTLFYQWRFNGGDIAGATSTTLSLSSVQPGDAGGYSVLVSNAVGPVTSGTATLTVNPAPVAPSITSPPASQTVATGASATFSVTATGTGPLSYRWRFNGVNITGATASTYTLNNAQAGNAGAYSVVVSNVAGSVTSADAVLTVLPPPPVGPTIVASPASKTVAVGSSVSLSVTATGTGPLFYQWRFNGTEIAGATSATFTIASAQNSDGGSYDVIVSNVVSTATSAPATLAVVVGGPAAAGVYQGLFYDTNAVAMASSGYFVVKVSSNGSFKANMRAGVDRIAFKGKFDVAGHVLATGLGKRKLTAELQLGSATGGDGLTGRVTDGQWNGTLLGDRDVFDPATNPAPYAGNYGMVIPNSSVQPQSENDSGPGAGNNVGSVTVNNSGGVKFSGKLVNNLTSSQTTALSKSGDWPFYVVLPRHNGIAIGWINFNGQTNAVATGTLLWLQPTDPPGGGVELPVQVRVPHHDN